jgi:hypothetical protein
MYLTAIWLMQTPRDQVLKEAGTELHFPFDKEKSKSMSTMFRGKKATPDAEWRNVKTVVPEDESPVVPMFNVVDDGDSTQDSIAKAVADVWNVKYGFLSTTIMTLVAQFAKVGPVFAVADRRTTLRRWWRTSTRRLVRAWKLVPRAARLLRLRPRAE